MGLEVLGIEYNSVVTLGPLIWGYICSYEAEPLRIGRPGKLWFRVARSVTGI